MEFDKKTILKIVATAAISTLTGFLVMEIMKRITKRDDITAKPLPPGLTGMDCMNCMHGMPGHEMASAHWRRY